MLGHGLALLDKHGSRKVTLRSGRQLQTVSLVRYRHFFNRGPGLSAAFGPRSCPAQLARTQSM